MRTAGPRRQLAVASAAVLLAAADTYVVVVALPAIMGGIGLGLDQLQRATPVISGFLLGYIAVLPLLGRLSDVAGRRPVLLACLACFAIGSLVTATAHALSVLVVGRALQGLGGGGLVPVTLSLVAARWSPERRGLPLGVVGAVQELGSVLGPLYGAVVVAVSTWRAIFWVNLPLAAVLAAAFAAGGPDTAPAGPGDGRRRSTRRDVVGTVLLGAATVAVGVALWSPASLATSVTWGRLLTPEVGGAAWVGLSTPLAIAGGALFTAFLVREATAGADVRRLVDLRAVASACRKADLPGAVLLAVFLGCVVVAFSTADPSRQVIASSAPLLAPVAALVLAGFVWRQRRAASPLLAPGALRARPAWGSLAVNLALGAGLMAALVDVPFFARSTRYPSSELGAALVLVRFLVAVPVGALAGGALLRRIGRPAPIAGAGAALAAAAFASMATWGPDALSGPAASIELVACGLGFGLAIAPVNAAVLATVESEAHGLASALVVVARTVGMLAGLSALTAIGLRRFYEAQARIGSPLQLCPSHPQACPAYDTATRAALLRELHTIFAGAALCCAGGAVLAVVLLPLGRARARGDAVLAATTGSTASTG